MFQLRTCVAGQSGDIFQLADELVFRLCGHVNVFRRFFTHPAIGDSSLDLAVVARTSDLLISRGRRIAHLFISEASSFSRL